MPQFKEGDKIRMKETCCDSIEGQVYTLEINESDALVASLPEDTSLVEGRCDCQDKWEPVIEAIPAVPRVPKFILFYLNDNKLRKEEFVALAEVKVKIKQLLTERYVEKKSFALYEIASPRQVTIEDKITISG